MQNAVIGMIVGASFLGLTLVAIRSRRRGGGALELQLAMGLIIGGLAAAITVSVRADLIPDDVEAIVAATLVLLTTLGLILIVVRHQAQ